MDHWGSWLPCSHLLPKHQFYSGSPETQRKILIWSRFRCRCRDYLVWWKCQQNMRKCSADTQPFTTGISLHWGIELSQNQGPFLPLMPDKTILCYICSWSHGSPHEYSLVGGLVSGSSGVSGWLIMLFFLWVANPFSFFSPFSNSSIGDPVLSPMMQSSAYVLVRLWHSLSRNSWISILSASSSWHPQYCLSLVTVYGLDPQVGQSLVGLSFSLCSTLCLQISSYEYFVYPSKNH